MVLHGIDDKPDNGQEEEEEDDDESDDVVLLHFAFLSFSPLLNLFCDCGVDVSLCRTSVTFRTGMLNIPIDKRVCLS